jgi:PhzF family phenazine biosynthesis protein
MTKVDMVHVFTHDGRGGNPCPIVMDAGAMADADMQAVAQTHGHESGFILPPPNEDFDHAFRFWVPNHEMEMCGHATVGALWLLASAGQLGNGEARIHTASGAVTGFTAVGTDGAPAIEITQPAGKVRALGDAEEAFVLKALGISRGDLLDLPVQNAVTSRVKTLVPMKDADALNALAPDPSAIEPACAAIGSTGLYPYAVLSGDTQTFDARQFPRSSGYPEDAATGIAAAALAFGLLENDLVARSADPIRIMQGRAMGSLSQIDIRLGFAGDRAIGCLLGGAVTRR